MLTNPFVTSGYVSPEYFCDRVEETEQLVRDIQGFCHTVLISPRRMGKTGLIQHCFNQPEIRDSFYCIFIDIYATLNLNDFIHQLGNEICKTLKKQQKSALETFIRIVKSIEFKIGMDEKGMLSASFGLKDIKDSQATLDEIFEFIKTADKPCVIAIDEFQQIGKYPEKNVEALLRTQIQHCANATFIFAGSQRHLLQNMFSSVAKPFYHSATILTLNPLSKESYTQFVIEKFRNANKEITEEQVALVYDQFEGHTWYMQVIFYLVYFLSQPACTDGIILTAIDKRIMENDDIYATLLYGIPEKQQRVLRAIAAEGTVSQPQSFAFINKHSLNSASSVQSAIGKLLDKDLITLYRNEYSINDKFFGQWLRRM